GYWPDGSVSYVSRIYSSNIALPGYDVGSSGIADSLPSLYDYNAKLTLLETSARAEKFVLSLLNDDYSLPVGLAYQSNRLTGKSLGTAGLALQQLRLYEKFGTSRHIELAINIFNHLYGLFKINNNVLPLDETDNLFGFSFNLEDGIAGIGDILLYYESVIAGTGGDKYEQIYSEVDPNLSLPEDTKEKSSSSKSTFPSFYINFLLIVSIQIIMIKRLKQK
ncbi:MAG: hypothetical protein ACW99Q_18540, partial [Candidatus Kariarchaeaceae archaeon]